MGQDIDDTLESLYRVLIEAHIDRGEATQARQAYRSCVDVLTKRLKILPSPATQALARKLQ
jgi:DNA-binding SARP family transcriptional activator